MMDTWNQSIVSENVEVRPKHEQLICFCSAGFDAAIAWKFHQLRETSDLVQSRVLGLLFVEKYKSWKKYDLFRPQAKVLGSWAGIGEISYIFQSCDVFLRAFSPPKYWQNPKDPLQRLGFKGLDF